MADNTPRFGASDFFLVQTDAAQLREQLRSALEAVLGRSVVDADPHMVLASAFLPYLVQGQASADACAKATLRAFAVGQDLDRIADSTCVVGYLARLPARGAVLAYVMYCEIDRSSGIQESQCALSWTATRVVEVDGEEVTFRGSGVEYIDFLATDGTEKLVRIPIYLVCDEPGAKYNGLFTEEYPPFYQNDPDVVITVTGTESGEGVGEDYTVSNIGGQRCGTAYNGTDEEDDAHFAQRVAWQAKALRVAGSLEYFRLALSELHLLADAYVAPTVDDEGRIVFCWADKVQFYSARAGVPTTTRGAAYDEFYRAVKGSLLVEQRGYVYPALWDYNTDYVMNYRLPANTQDIASDRSVVESAWSEYVAAHAWRCGAALRTSDMMRVLMDAGASTVWQTGGTQSIILPADTIVIDSAFRIVYQGLSTDSLPPSGGSGEEVVP